MKRSITQWPTASLTLLESTLVMSISSSGGQMSIALSVCWRLLSLSATLHSSCHSFHPNIRPNKTADATVLSDEAHRSFLMSCVYETTRSAAAYSSSIQRFSYSKCDASFFLVCDSAFCVRRSHKESGYYAQSGEPPRVRRTPGLQATVS